MVPWCLSPAKFLEALIRRRFMSSGLTPQTLAVDSDTTVAFWGPPPLTWTENEKPALLLLHGFGPSATWQWHRQVGPLSAVFRLYIPDLIFFGGSATKSAGERSEIFQAVCMAKLMEKVGVERFDVVGTSYGGFVAYHMGKMWPGKVGKVVLASSGVNMRRSDNEELLGRAKCGSIEEVMLPSTATELRRLTEVVSLQRLNFVPDFFLNDFLEKMYSENRKEKLELLKGLSIGRDETVNLTRLQQDVLLIWGDQDGVFPLKMAHELNQILGEKSRLEVIKRASHLPQAEKPNDFNRILKAFLCAYSTSQL